MPTPSTSINIAFIATVIVTTILFYLATPKSKTALSIVLSWAFLQSIIGYNGFYTEINTVPPRFIFMVLPPLIVILLTFFTSVGKTFIDQLDLKWLTLIHIVRLPIEVILYALFLQQQIPHVMTFEGRNFDIIMGITALPVFYFIYIKQRLNTRFLLLWNIIGVILVLNVAITGLLSSPALFQKFGFEQPNLAVQYFPLNLLPALIVPIVLFSHLAAIRKIIRSTIAYKKNDNANVIIFPPLLFLITAALAISTKLFLPAVQFPLPVQLSGFAWIMLGMLIMMAAVRQLNLHKTTVHPDGITTAIVTQGIFKYSRNPIYVSFTLLYLGIMLLVNSLMGILFLLPLLIITQKGIVEREEKYLTKKFGEEYTNYKSQVRRWF